jgi:hypothetical protein
MESDREQTRIEVGTAVLCVRFGLDPTDCRVSNIFQKRFPCPLWGGVGGGGRRCGSLNVLKHPVNISQDFIIPVPQHAVAILCENSRALRVRSYLYCVLASINLNNQPLRMTREVDDVTTDSHLTTKMRSSHTEPVTQMPPQFALCLCRHTSHLPGKLSLRRLFGAITLGPNSWIVRCRHCHPSNRDPHPRPLPTRGRGAVRVCRAAAGSLTPSPARDSRAAGGTSTDSPTRSSASRR